MLTKTYFLSCFADGTQCTLDTISCTLRGYNFVCLENSLTNSCPCEEFCPTSDLNVHADKIFLDTTSLETASSCFVFSETYQQTKRARKAEKEKSAMVQAQNCSSNSLYITLIVLKSLHGDKVEFFFSLLANC